MSNLHNQLAVAEQEDVARGVRLLLRHPVITQVSDEDSFDLIRRRHQPLQAWFDYHCGWPLLVEPRLGYARLMKIGSIDDPTRPARRLRSGHAPFDRRRYALFCVVAAELLDTPITTIGLLADRVTQACAADEVLPGFDSSHRGERMAFVDVLRLLASLGAVEVLDGSADGYVDSAEAKVLYRVNATLLIRLVSAPGSPSRLAVPLGEVPLRFSNLLAELNRETRYGTAEPGAAPGSDVQRTLWLRHSILRRLFNEPVLYRAELTPEQSDYLASPTGRQIMRRSAAQAGFVLEERAEGFLLVDPDGIATDVTFPDGSSTAKVAALLLLDHLREPPGVRTWRELVAHTGTILDRFPSWARTYQSEDGRQRLAGEAIELLTLFRLAGWSGDLLMPLPAAGRYAVEVTAPATASSTTRAAAAVSVVFTETVASVAVPPVAGGHREETLW